MSDDWKAPSARATELLEALQAPEVYYATCCFDCMKVYTTQETAGKYAVCSCGVPLPWLVRLNVDSWEGEPTAERMLAYAERLEARRKANAASQSHDQGKEGGMGQDEGKGRE